MADSKPSLVLFSISSDIFCKKMKGEWLKATDYFRDNEICETHMFERDFNDEDRINLFRKANVNVVPTIRLYPKGYNSESTDYIKYRGERTSEDFIKFVEAKGQASPEE